MLIGASVLVGGCGLTTMNTPAGDFCAVVSEPFYYEDEGVADFVAMNDPRLADKIDATNVYGSRHCPGWGF